MNKKTETINRVRQFAQRCKYEKQHSEQVAQLAEQLFDLLAPVHGFSADQKWLLTAACLLHDIGWIAGQSKHHKTSMSMILADTTMPLEQPHRNLIALIARYHRKALPKESHPVYGQLTVDQQRIVAVLGGILRLADGLDRSHTNAVRSLDVRISSVLLQVFCSGGTSVSNEIQFGQKKTDLLEHSLNRKVQVVCQCDENRT